ncbi:MAG: carbamoyltransferase HypF [gamma proteobacterium symbiont of Bathyaustriella thionipta]|nr:carbamoyltransferase HypF [gamma proteobacterium symbiont of Bathyaustriella thionipta]
MPTRADSSARHIILSGQVQGVVFRPFVYRLAQQHALCGWVRNCMGQVEIHIQGKLQSLHDFQADLLAKKPPLARPVLESSQPVEAEACDDFHILQSQSQGRARISVPTDLYLCDDCLAEMNDPADRRYSYPFINCTQCGPRYTLIRSLPYDRANTSMAEFPLCPACLAEYEEPANRRFHAEPVACPQCGPALAFHAGDVQQEGNEAALKACLQALQQGQIVAVKGIGGYHLMCDAGSDEAVARLRRRKPRPHKPLAVMFPVDSQQPFRHMQSSLRLTEAEEAFLLQAERPILLLTQKPQSRLSKHIAPGLNEVGLMLPYSPLHHLLLNGFGQPLLATSANISGEPVLTDAEEVEKRLQAVADAFLHHNRPIVRPADDPVYRTIAAQPRPVRLGRGCAPMELTLPFALPQPLLALGAQMKNCITLAWDNRAVISPHIGEMDSARSLQVFENTVKDLQKLYAVEARLLVGDAHPAYSSRHWARRQNLPLHTVFHHHAHASAAYFECDTRQHVLAFTWDGVGFGEDGTLWGGEALLGRPGHWQRVASMRPFRLPGGDKAGRQPWRSAAALCWEAGLSCSVVPQGSELLYQAWQKQLNAPQTTSVGRLFDAAAALIGVCSQASFEGQGPMLLEAQCEALTEAVDLPLTQENEVWISDWQPLLALLQDNTCSTSKRATLFHASMAQVIVQQAQRIRDESGVNHVTLCGGVFQNRLLTENAIIRLEKAGFQVTLPAKIPLNDAAISFGQVIEYGLSESS